MHAVSTLNDVNLLTLERSLKAKDIPNHFLPCIIFDKTNNPLVLLKKSSSKALIFDPNTEKESEVDLQTLSPFSKAVLIFKQLRFLNEAHALTKKAWFYEPMKPLWRSHVEVGLLTLFINLFALAVPLFAMSVYDRVIPNQAYETLFVLSVGVILMLIFDLIFKYARNHILEENAKKIGLFWEEALMRKMINLEAQFDSYMTGNKANLFKELHQIRDFFAIRSLMQIIDFPFFLFALVAIFLISPTMAIVPTVFAVLILAISGFSQLVMSKLSKNNSKNIQSKHNFIVESIQGAESLKLNNASAARMFTWKKIVALTDSLGMRIQSIHVFSMNFSQLAIQLVVVFVVVVGVFEIGKQALSTGGLIAITILAGRAMMPVANLSGMLSRLKEINESINRIDEFMMLPSEHDEAKELGIGALGGKIEYKNVTYAFKDSRYASVENISLSILPGEKVGIIGQTGAGKSTLAKLLLGLHSPLHGSIYLDNHDISTIHPTEIRNNIGMMVQDPFLFNGTLKENIELSRPISKQKMMEIIKLVGLEELVKKTGKGDSLEVGERGSNLSVGQRHLVSLARAIVNDPPILILDEPTTGLDLGLEKKLIKHLLVATKEKTLVIITHRFAALELVDRLIVLDEGKIVADGPKEKILSALQHSQGTRA